MDYAFSGQAINPDDPPNLYRLVLNMTFVTIVTELVIENEL